MWHVSADAKIEHRCRNLLKDGGNSGTLLPASRDSPASASQPKLGCNGGILCIAFQRVCVGSLILALVAIFAAFTWGRIVTARAEREAREMAESAVKKWLTNVAPPLIAREAAEFLRTFRGEGTISDDDLAKLVTAVGNDGKEGKNGKE